MTTRISTGVGEQLLSELPAYGLALGQNQIVTQRDLRSMAALTPPSSRDWLDYLSAWSGLVGALLAALAIVYAAWQAAQSKRDLIRERRLEFELGLLAEIRRQMSITQLQHLSGYVGALIVDPADESDIPVLRAALGVKDGPEGRRRLESLRARTQGAGGRFDGTLQEVQREVDIAIQRRIEE